jgi:hypothetical protein
MNGAKNGRASKLAKTGRGFFRRIVLVALASAVTATIVIAKASPASAAVKLSNGASASTVIVCSQSMGSVRTTVTMTPRSGLASQAVAWRRWIQPVSGSGFWTNWTSASAPFQSTYVAYVRGVDFTVYMQYAWYYQGSWTYAGEWVTSYGQTLGQGVTWMSYCAT